MPVINAPPRRMGRDVVTELIDSVGTTEVTYSFSQTEPQDSIKINNLSGATLVVTVGSQSNIQVIGFGEISITNESFTFFKIKSQTGQGSFRMVSSFKDVDEGDEQDLSNQLKEIANNSRYLNINETKMFAHRGASNFAPENTIPSFVLAGQMGFWGCETDCYNTLDGKFVILHDNDMVRTTTYAGTQKIWEMTYADTQLYTVDVGEGLQAGQIAKFPSLTIPTLDEYLLICNRYNMVPVIEIKIFSSNTLYDDFIAVIKKYRKLEDVIIISFDLVALRQTRQRSKLVTLGYVTNTIDQTSIDICKSIGNCFIDATANAGVSQYSQANVELCHSQGIKTGFWVVNTPELVDQMKRSSVGFITTNYMP